MFSLVPLVSLATIFIQQSLRIGIAITLKLRHKSAQSHPLTSRGIGKQYEMIVPDLSILTSRLAKTQTWFLTFHKEVQSCETDWVTKQVPLLFKHIFKSSYLEILSKS